MKIFIQQPPDENSCRDWAADGTDDPVRRRAGWDVELAYLLQYTISLIPGI